MSAQKYRQKATSGIITLAFWQVRIVWRLLLIEGIGVIIAVMLACAIPFYTQVNAAITFRASLQTFLGNDSTIRIQANTNTLSSSLIQQSTRQLDGVFRHDLGTYTTASPYLTMQTPALALLSHGQLSSKEITLNGRDLHVLQHSTLISGRLPEDSSSGNSIEIALSQTDANVLHAGLGTTLTIRVPFIGSSAMVIGAYQQPLTVVGILSNFPEVAQNSSINVLTSQAQLLNAFGQLTKKAQAIDSRAALTDPFTLLWSYPFDTSRITIQQTNALDGAINALLVDAPNSINHPPNIQNVQVVGNVAKFNQYASQTQAFQVPVTLLALQVLALLIFFVSVMAELLVERQATAIALLHSRGASEEQVFGAMVVQGMLPGVVALVVGPFLAIGLVSLLVQTTLPVAEQHVLALSPFYIASSALSLVWYALPTALIAVISIIIAMRRATLTDMLTLRREATRSTEKPFWQRLYLDVFVALIALTAYSVSTYVTHSGLLDAQSSVLIAAPLEQIAPLFLLVGILLLVLRLLPLLLRVGAFLALKGRGALNMLALSQMARTSGHIIRLTLLLTIAVAFLIFSQVLSASQSHHLVDVANFQVGSNFGGTIASPVSISMNKNEPPLSYIARTMAAQTTPYLHIPGVLAASPAYVDTLTDPTSGQQVAIRAIDTNTFARTITWTPQDSTQSLSMLLSQLKAAENNVSFINMIPAFVDAAMWNALNLSQSTTFSLSDSQTALNFVAIGEVQNIPTIVDGNTGSNNGESIEGGILVDYQKYVASYMTANPTRSISQLPISINYMWLKTETNATAHIRRVLTTGQLQLSPLNDNSALLEQLQQSTVQHNLISMISFVAIAPLLLALVGSLLASWMSVRSRLTSFAVLRALGCTPRQIASTLSIELVLVYVSAIILGSILGLILSLQTVPHLVFTDASSAASSGAVFLAQSVPAVRAVIPNTLIMLLVLFVLLCLGTLGLMVYTVSRPATGQALRVNKD